MPNIFDRSGYLALRRHEKVDILQHVQEKLIPPVLDPFPPPSDLPRHLDTASSLATYRYRSVVQNTTKTQYWVQLSDGGGEGAGVKAESYDRKKARASINHSILSVKGQL